MINGKIQFLNEKEGEGKDLDFGNYFNKGIGKETSHKESLFQHKETGIRNKTRLLDKYPDKYFRLVKVSHEVEDFNYVLMGESDKSEVFLDVDSLTFVSSVEHYEAKTFKTYEEALKYKAAFRLIHDINIKIVKQEIGGKKGKYAD